MIETGEERRLSGLERSDKTGKPMRVAASPACVASGLLGSMIETGEEKRLSGLERSDKK